MPIITISRGTLAGGTKLAEEVGKRLGYQVISRELIFEAARAYGITEIELREGLEVPPGLWQRITHQKERYILAAQAALADILQGTDCVYHGYCGQLLVKDQPGAIKLRLIAPLEKRVETAMAMHGISRGEALRMIHTNDEQRERWVRTLSGYDINDASLYDMVISLEQMSLEAAVDVVERLVRGQKTANSPEAAQALRDFLLGCRVKAAITFKSDFPPNSVDVRAEGGKVLVSGPAVDRNRAKVVEFVAALPGVKEVQAVEWGAGALGAAAHGKTARDIMLPIDRYPRVRESVSIRDAMLALGTSVVSLPDGHQIMPRFLLVFDDQENLVGIVNRRSLITGLIPKLKAIEEVTERAHGPIRMSGTPDPMDFLWPTLFSKEAVENARNPLSSVTRPIRGQVYVDTELSIVARTMLQQDVDLLPVKDGKRTVGVILMTEVFNAVAEFVAEGEARSRRRS